MTERAWCVAHDRSAEFETTDQERVCWVGLCDPEARCRLVLVTVERKNDTDELLASSHRSLSIAMEELDAANVRLAQIAEIASLKARWAVAEPPSDTFARIGKIARGEEPA